ncbi:hypothetical protein IEQ34_010830 [Dendrobium chrysotoxum]|uniref:Uncharacterized protein n=1 Tax=Dendrobium chrysotoxum TaxID=161865 RepID=A0AAV7GUN3_DENCH|nr:hypothetical protein IEQ34_010830 [Dendrobium chrysotoxum]
MENRFRRVEEMLRRLLEMQTKTLLGVPMANPNQNLTEIPLADSKGNEIGQEEFDEGSFFHQEPSLGAPIRGGSIFLDERTTKRKSFGRGGRAVDHYERHFGQGEWAIGGGGQEPPSRAPIRGGIGLSDGGTVGREFRGEGKWTTEGGGRAEQWGLGHVRRREGRWDSHPRYMGEIWRDHDNCYTRGERSYWGGSDHRVRKLRMPVFEMEDAYE